MSPPTDDCDRDPCLLHKTCHCMCICGAENPDGTPVDDCQDCRDWTAEWENR